MISPYPLLFFGGNITVLVEEGHEIIAVDDFIRFRSPRKIANLVKVMTE
jgi:ATP-dependent RNA helicase DHX36